MRFSFFRLVRSLPWTLVLLFFQANAFGRFRMEWDGQGGKRTGFDGSLLRIWRKVDGQWLAEAMFARPNEEAARDEGKRE